VINATGLFVYHKLLFIDQGFQRFLLSAILAPSYITITNEKFNRTNSRPQEQSKQSIKKNFKVDPAIGVSRFRINCKGIIAGILY